MRTLWDEHRRTVLALLAAIAATVAGVVVVVDDTDHDGRLDRVTVTMKVNQTPDAPPSAPDTITVPAEAIDAASVALERDLRHDARNLREVEQQAPGQLNQAQEAIARVKATQDPLPTAGASAGFKGCVTRFVVNQSSRGGARPIWQVLHYTVSANRPGWSDVNAIVALFNTPSYKASSSFVIDREGNCAYIVPIESTPWTQVAGNRLAISYEIINTGGERPFMETAGYDKLRSVMTEVARRTGIPMRAGSVYPARAGIVQHADGGIAWGGHDDINPFSKADVIRIVTTREPGPAVRRWCRKAHAERLHHRRPHESRKTHRQHKRRQHRRDALRRELARKHGFRCKAGKPVALKG